MPVLHMEPALLILKTPEDEVALLPVDTKSKRAIPQAMAPTHS